MGSMFQMCKELEYLDLSNFNTSNVITMGDMFNKCHKLKEIKGINKLITNQVIDMKRMFHECYELKFLDLSNFDTSKVTNMEGMFKKCHKLKEIKGLNSFVTNKVNNMRGMFQECGELEYLDLSNFDTKNVEDIKDIFSECLSLKSTPDLPKSNILKDITKTDSIQQTQNIYPEETIYLDIVYETKNKDNKKIGNSFQNKLRLFGNNFILNNKNNNKYKIIYQGIEYNPKEYFEEINNNYINKDLIKIIPQIINIFFQTELIDNKYKFSENYINKMIK